MSDVTKQNPFDQFDAQPDGGNAFDKFDLPAGVKPRSAMGEVGSQLKAGFVAELPKMLGQAMQYSSEPGLVRYKLGKDLADFGREQAERPDLQPQEAHHGSVTNALAGGARMIAPSVVPALTVGAALRGGGVKGGAGLLAGAALGSVPAGMSQAQDTLDRGLEKGLNPDDALSAARKTGLIEWGGETIGTAALGSMFGLLGRIVPKSGVGSAAEQTLGQVTSTEFLKPWLKQIPKTAAIEVGTEIGQSAGQTAVENAYGISDQSPLEAAKHVIGPTLGMTALLAPFGLAGNAMNAREQQKRNETFVAGDADQAARTRIAAEIAPQIEKVDRAAAANFRANVARAISANQPLSIDSSLFADPTQQTAAPAAAATPEATDDGTDLAPPPPGPLTAAADKARKPLFPFATSQVAQKQADSLTTSTGIPHQVIPHPTVAGRFTAVPVQQPEAPQDAAPLSTAAGLDPADNPEAGAPIAPAAPVALQPGETVQVTLDGVDQFEGGTQLVDLSDDGQWAMVQGSDEAVPVTSLTRFDPALNAAIDAGAHEAATSDLNDRTPPSEAQQHAGNYKKGPAQLQGLNLMIENPVGTTREGKDPDGTPWATTMSDHYGYIKGTKGADGQEVDTYVGPNPASHHVFVIDQMNQETGEFDEHKVMLGFNSPEQAQKAYEAHYAEDWQGSDRITATTIDGLKDWIKRGDTTQAFNPDFYRQPSLPAAPLEIQGDQAPEVDTAAQAEHEARYGEIEREIEAATAAGDLDTAQSLREEIGLMESDRLAMEQAPAAPAAPARQWTYSDGTPASPEDADLYQRASDAYKWAFDQTPDVKENTLRREQLQANIENPSDLREDVNDKGLRVGDRVARGTSGVIETVTSIKNREVNGKVITEVKTISPGSYGGWGKLEWFNKVESRAEQQQLAPATQEVAADSPDAPKSSAPQVLSQQQLKAKLEHYKKDGTDEQGRQIYRQFNDAGESEVIVDKDGRVVRDFGIYKTFDLDDKRSVELSHDNLSGEWRATEYGADNQPGKSVVLSADDIKYDQLEEVLRSRFGAEKVEELDRLVARTPAKAWATRPDARKQPGFNRRQFEDDVRQYDWGIVGVRTNPATLSAHKALGKKLSDPANYMTPVDKMADMIAQLDSEIAEAQKKLDTTVAEQKEAEQRGNGWVYVTRLKVERKMLASLTETRDSLVKAQQANVPAPAAPHPAKEPGVDYPNRKLGFQKARSGPDEEYNEHAWANIAAANMKPGDTFKLNGKQHTVESISDKTLKIKDADGKVRTLNPDGVAWDQFKRDLGGQLASENLQAKNILKPKRPLIEILKRDPAVHVDANGSVHLRDGGPVPAAPAKQQKEAPSTWENPSLADQLDALQDEHAHHPERKDRKTVAGNHVFSFKFRRAIPISQEALDQFVPLKGEELKAATARVEQQWVEERQRQQAEKDNFPTRGFEHVIKPDSSDVQLQLATAIGWGFTKETVPVRYPGSIDTVFHDYEIGLGYDNGKGGASSKQIEFRVLVAQGPNGNWAYSTEYGFGHGGGGSHPSIWDPQYPTRDQAITAGTNELRQKAKDREDVLKLIDREYAKLGITGEAKAVAPTGDWPWKGSPFAARIDAMLAKLAEHAPDYLRAYRSGFVQDANSNRLTEESVAFKEKKVDQLVGEKTGKTTAVPFTPIDAAGMQEVTDVSKALPKEIVDAAIAKWNPLAEKLAALGYHHGEVDASKPQAARELDAQLREIAHALMGLAPRRYMAAKEHKNADPQKLARDEDFASRVLGINTRDYPGIDTSRQITLGAGVKDKPQAQKPNLRDTAFADRVDAMTDQLDKVGREDIARSIKYDLQTALERGTLDEAMVARQEKVASNIVASLAAEPGQPMVVTQGENGEPVVDIGRIVFKGTGAADQEVSDTLLARVQQALRTRPDAYELSRRYTQNDTRITLPKSPDAERNSNNGGQFILRDNGQVFLLGDDEFGWASTMSQKSVTRTLTNWLKHHIDGKAAPAKQQEKVHEYDADEAKPLLIIACTETKLKGKHRAIDLYQGALFEVLNKWMPKGKLDVYVISAKHGLVPADRMLESYDQKMTEARAAELSKQGVDLKDFAGKNFSEVYIAGSNLYRPVGQAYAEQLRAAGHVGPDAKVDGVTGFIGQQRGQLGDYLRAVAERDAQLPENPAPLAVGVRVRVKRLTAEPVGSYGADYNRFAGRTGVVEREMIVGENRYFLVNLDDTPKHVERVQEFFSQDLEVLTPASEAGQAAPGALPSDPEARKAHVRERIDAALAKDEVLIVQGDLERTGNQFKDFKDLYKAAFEKALGKLFADKVIEADDVAVFSNSLDKLPGYLERAARQFIADHHGAQKTRDMDYHARFKWGFPEGVIPEFGKFETYETAVQYDNKRFGKEQLAFEIRVVQAPNGKWAVSWGYSQGGNSGNGIGVSIQAPSLMSQEYPSRETAVDAGATAIKRALNDHLPDATKQNSAVNLAVSKAAKAPTTLREGVRVQVNHEQKRLGGPKFPGREGIVQTKNSIGDDHWYVKLEATKRAKERIELFEAKDLTVLTTVSEVAHLPPMTGDVLKEKLGKTGTVEFGGNKYALKEGTRGGWVIDVTYANGVTETLGDKGMRDPSRPVALQVAADHAITWWLDGRKEPAPAAAPEAPQAKQDAPGTRRYPAPMRAAIATRLEKLLETFTASRFTPEGAARSVIRNVIEELRKEKTVIDLPARLNEASNRLMRQFGAQAKVLDEVGEQLQGKATQAAPEEQPQQDGALAGKHPMSRKDFIETLTSTGKVQFGEATFEVKLGMRTGVGRMRVDTYVVNATYPYHNKVIGAGQNLSQQQAIARAAGEAFDWWNNDRVKDAEFAKRREKLVRTGQRELYGVLSRNADLMAKAADLDNISFAMAVNRATVEWVAEQKAAGNLDADRQLMLDNMVIAGKPMLGMDFADSLRKYLVRAAKRAEKELDRDPAVYEAALIKAAQEAGEPAENIVLFKVGFDHALAGKTKSTLPPVAKIAKGYEAGAAWIKTDEGEAWYTGRRGKKLENTGAALRRWFDEASRKIKEVTADNLPASYEIIKGQASRVDAFANVAGEGATPGTKRYITAVRDEIKPFQEWLLDIGPLGTLYGEIGYRESDSFKIARFLDGRAYTYTYEADGKRTSMEDATAQQRLELLQEAAETYNERLRGLADAMAGAKTVAEAAQRYQDYLVADKAAYVWADSRLTENGKTISAMMRGSVHQLEPGYHVVNELAKKENEPDAPLNRKQALLVPKLDRVVREGEKLADYRKGKNVTPQQMKETFGFADIGFGKYVAAKQDQDHLNYAYDAFMDLANLLGIDPTHIGLGGTLHFAVGALGHGRHAAHFQAKQPHPDGGTVPVINVTNTKGDGTVAHEWFHALDHALSAGWNGPTWKQGAAVTRVVQLLSSRRDLERLAAKLQGYVSGRRFMRRGRSNTPIYNTKTEEGLIRNAEAGLQWEAGQQSAMQTEYKRQADAMGEDYWGNPRELLARAAEAWVHDTLGGVSNYLVNPAWVGEGKIQAPAYKGAPYPMGEERKLFNDAIGALVKSLRFDDKGVTVDTETFDKEFPDVARQFKEGYDDLKSQIPEMVRLHLAQKEAKELARKHAESEAERAAQAKALAEQQAAREAEAARLREQLQKEAQAPAAPPAGPLSMDDLEALFDQAERELAEEQQEQPEAEAPGEPVKHDHWTQEDYRHLVQLADEGQVFLLADGSLGLATIHDMKNAVHLGYGTFRRSTPAFEILFEGGGQMKSTPSGKAYTLVSIKNGREAFLKEIGWDQAKTRLQAKLMVKSGPKAAPTLSQEQQKSAGKLIAEAAKLGVTGINEALEGLVQLFGGNGLKSFPAGMDEDAYRKAKPHFEASLRAFQEAGHTIVELFKFLLRNMGPGVRPYALHFVHEKGLSFQLAPPQSATEQVASKVQQWLASGETFTSNKLFEAADAAYGGTLAENKYTVKDAYDAMEAGMNRHIMAQNVTPDGSATDAVHKLAELEKWTGQMATQTRRTAEMDEYQQFSTPPGQAFVAAWVANIQPGEQMLEPSAGTGSLAVYAQLAGARVTVNELSSRRAEVLATVLPQARLFKENAEQLHNILPDEVRPSVIVMNPPFSSTAGRMAGERDTMNGGLHIEQALRRLEQGGRLVAIVGNGMAEGKPAFKAWWNKIKQDYTVRANVGVDGSNYAKYGTTFDNQILVIDKTGPTKGEVLTGQVKTLAELPAMLEGIRNERVVSREAVQGPGVPDDAGQPDADQQGGSAVPGGQAPAGPRTGGPDADPLGTGERDRTGAAGPGAAGRGEHDEHADRDGDQVGAAKRGQVPDQPDQRRPAGRGADGGNAGGAAKRGGRGSAPDREPVRRDGGDGPVAGEVTVQAQDQAAAEGELSDAIFESYTPQRLSVPGAKPHPGKLVQSAAMAAVVPPAPSYSPNLPKAVIDKGLLSLAQLEAVVYAGQAHSEMLPGGKERRGFYVGDGTGVGKGREIAGIILDNWRQGRKKAVWLSAKQGLLRDAQRDFGGISGDPSLLLAHNKVKADDKIDAKEGILFTTYDTLKMGAELGAPKKGKGKDKEKPAGKSRLDQIVAWLGEDFDGVIAFDEAHNMGNVLPRKGKRGTSQPAAKALAGVELQRRLPNARIVYVSATGATEVHNLGYATRLGLWGEGSAFAKVTDFIGGIESGGVAAMELVARDMKAQGSYLARSLSFDGVTYDRLEHELSPLQNDIYNELAKGWQVVLQNINEALEATGQGKDGKAKSAALAQFWGSHQRFFNHVITSMQMPSIIEAAQRDLDSGHAVVMQLVNTNEAEQERQAAKLADNDDAQPEDFDFTPRETLLNYVRHSFPVYQYEEFTDDNGNKAMRRVTDSKGQPVENREMVAKREQLVKNLEQIRVPDNPLDMILAAFGTDNVAEITGRKRRFVQVRDPKGGGYKVVEQKRPASSVPADADAFMEDKKRVLVFSDAGGTGYSFQSDNGVKNKRRRMHYLVQPGWRANNAVQGFGRTHRSNEANQPHYVLPTTNLKAQKRFISSIARRLDQLGALTKGQRETGGQGMFSATDNLESQYSTDALYNLFTDMYNGQAKLNFQETTEALGLNGLINEDTGGLNTSKLPSVPQFLNRLLSLTTERQDEVFEEFFNRLVEVIERAKANGTFDSGMETLVAQKVAKVRDEVVYTDQRTDAKTRYVELELTHPTHFNSFDEASQRFEVQSERFQGYFRNERSGKVFGLIRTGTSTDAKTGALVTRGARLHPTGGWKYGDEYDKILQGARGEKTIKKKIMVAHYKRPGTEVMVEKYEKRVGDKTQVVEIPDTRLGTLLAQRGLARVEQTILAGPPGAERDAFRRLLERMRPHLTESEAESTIPAFVRLTKEQAQVEWDAEIEATPKTYTEKTHLLTGMLLPIWDRLPGDPRVVRTQTEDGERLLGRVVAEWNLDRTLKNLGVGSNLGKIPPATVLQRLLDGERGVLANGWMLNRARVSNDTRIEILGLSMYGTGDRNLLVSQGAFVERINWMDRVFIPTGEKGAEVLGRILESKPLVELGKPGQAQDEEAEFSRGDGGAGMARFAVEREAARITEGWGNAPVVHVVQSVGELPFAAPSDTRGAAWQGKVYLVADNLAHEGEVQFVVAHEALGHMGLSAILGPDALAKELNRLRLINPELAKAARAQVAKYGYDMQLATEEALADMAGSGATINGWQQFVAKVQAALRAIGLDRVADWIEGHTQAETMDLLRRARAAIEGRKAPRLFREASAARFSDGQADRWYSQLARQVESLPMKSATALQWAETIMGSGFAQKGVKQDEIYWTGVLEWLEMQGSSTKVPKSALLDYLAENGVRVTESVLGAPLPMSMEGVAARRAVFDKYSERINALQRRAIDFTLPSRENEEAQVELEELMTQRDREADEAYRLPADETPDSHYGKYQLPGGENYRELLLTLPEKTLTSPRLKQLEREMAAMDTLDTPEQFREWNRLADLKQAELDRLRVDAARDTYVSPHWEKTKNVLAHVRFNERVDADGKRVLFVEELQSDWAQQGRREGFRQGEEPTREEMAAAGAAARQVLEANDFLGFDYAVQAMDAIEKDADWKQRWELDKPEQYAVIDRYLELRKLNRTSRLKIPRGPFVEKTEAWLTLALKRVISHAAEHGFDRVAFVAGQQAADRFDLSKEVKAIQVERSISGDGYAVRAILPDDKQHTTVVYGDNALADFVGKELAVKAIEKLKTDPLGTARFEGDGLRLGGDGMRAFYDKIVPNTVNTLLKQLGGGKAAPIKLGDREKLYAQAQQARADGMVAGAREIEEDARRSLGTHVAFDITDAMRERVRGGLPLFARGENTLARYSRATPKEVARAAGATVKAVTLDTTKNKLVDLRSIGLQFLGRLQLTDLYGRLFPQENAPNLMQRYSELAARMDAEKADGGAAADAIVERWAKLKKPIGDDLARLMHDATRMEIDPSKPYDYSDNRKHYNELRKRYEQLEKRSPEAIKIYHDAAKAYAQHYQAVRTAVHERIARSLAAHPNRASLTAALEAEFFSRKIKGVYFPLARFGDYVIQVRYTGLNPQPGQTFSREAVAFAETLNEAEARREELLKEYPPERGFQVMPITKRAEFNAARDSVSRGFLKKLFGALDDAGMQDPSLLDTINQIYLTSLPDLSWAKTGIHRTGLPGFSQDARRAFAHHMFHGASYLAKLNYADQLTDVLESMQKYANAHATEADYDQIKAQQVIDEMTKRHDNYLNPKGNKLSTALTSIGFVWFLGLSPASAMVNLLQTPAVAYPILGGRFGYGKASAALIKASQDAAKAHNDMGKLLKGDELLAYKEWVRSGLVDLTMVHDLAGVSAGRDDQLYGTGRKVMKLASFMFHHAERFNRQATALAAYRLARANGQSHEEAYYTSVELTKAGHFDYSAGNRPRFMQGPIAQVLFLFKQYGQNLIYTFARNAAKAYKGDKEAMRTFAGLIGTHMVAAGVLGLPVVSTLLAAMSFFGSDADDPWDAKVALRRLFADLFGDQVGEVLSHGFSRLTPWDVSSRVGADHLILPDVNEGLTGEAWFDAYTAGLLGPVVGIGANLAKGASQIARGDVMRGWETMLPSVLRGPLRTFRYASEGVQDRDGLEILEETTLAEDAGQLLGFSPSRVREAQERNSAIKQRDQQLQKARSRLVENYARAVMREEDPSDALEAIQEFNDKHPNRIIAPLHLMQSVRARRMRLLRAEDGVYLPGRRGLDAREYGDFADEGGE